MLPVLALDTLVDGQAEPVPLLSLQPVGHLMVSAGIPDEVGVQDMPCVED